MTPLHIVFVAVAVFACAVVQVTSGFGFALLAMPLVTMVLGIEQAAPMIAVVALVLYTMNSVRLRKHANRRELARLVPASLLGLLPGFWISGNVPVAIVRTLLGVVLISYALYALVRPQRLPQCGDWWAWPVGFLGGALGAAYNVAGPPSVVYGDLRAWGRDEYRATLQTFFMISSVLVVGGHSLLGHYDGQIGMLILIAVPSVIAGNRVGVLTDRFLSGDSFRLLVKLLIMVTGIALLL